MRALLMRAPYVILACLYGFYGHADNSDLPSATPNKLTPVPTSTSLPTTAKPTPASTSTSDTSTSVSNKKTPASIPTSLPDTSAPTSVSADDTTAISVPIVMKAKDIDPIVDYPLSQIRLFKTDANGRAIPIPFQIDEANRYGDYIFNSSLPHDQSNGIFDNKDELSIMSEDLGLRKAPTQWDNGEPYLVYQVITNHPPPQNTFYVALFAGKKQPFAAKRYVKYDRKNAVIDTSVYRMVLNKRNYLAIEDVTLKLKQDQRISLIDWSNFYLKLDFKYFLTFEKDHRSIDSKLSAFRSGAIRTILRVNFILNLMKLKINPGFFTEISFFANALHLPAVIYSPFNHQKILRRGSKMYYGFALTENPSQLNIKTNMPRYDDSMRLKQSPRLHYWLGMYAPAYTILVDIDSNYRLYKNKFSPFLHVQDLPSNRLQRNDRNNPAKQVNTAVFFDLTRLAKGEQKFSFQSYFFNQAKSAQSTSLSDYQIFPISITIARGY